MNINATILDPAIQAQFDALVAQNTALLSQLAAAPKITDPVTVTDGTFTDPKGNDHKTYQFNSRRVRNGGFSLGLYKTAMVIALWESGKLGGEEIEKLVSEIEVG